MTHNDGASWGPRAGWNECRRGKDEGQLLKSGASEEKLWETGRVKRQTLPVSRHRPRRLAQVALVAAFAVVAYAQTLHFFVYGAAAAGRRSAAKTAKSYSLSQTSLPSGRIVLRR
jgi:hypothetical protein